MNEKQKHFSKMFLMGLNAFIKEAREETDLPEEEFKAMVAETFYLLGKNHEHFKKKAGII